MGAMYADWTKYGAGVTNYLSAPDMPMDTQGHGLQPARRLYRQRRPQDLQAHHFVPRRLLPGRRQGVHQALLVRRRLDQASLGRDHHSQVQRFCGRRQVLLGQVPDLQRQAGPGGAAGQRAVHAGRGPRAHQKIRHPGPGHGQQTGGRQGGAGGPALHHRPPRRPGHPLRRALRRGQQAVAGPDGQHRQG